MWRLRMSFSDARRQLPNMGAGLGYRGPLRPFFEQARRAFEERTRRLGETPVDEVEWAPGEHLIRCVEVVAEHFFSRDPQPPREVGSVPLLVHCLDFSLGTPGDLNRPYLEKVQEVLRRLNGAVLSDHLAFTRAGEIELGHLNPVPPTRANVRMIAAKIRQLQEECGVPFLLENITTHLSLPGELRAAEFYQQVVDEADCGMLLDVTNVMVNCRNRNLDPLQFIESLDLQRVVQLHLVGYSEHAGTLFDSHVEDISEDLFGLTRDVIDRAPVEAVIIERDGHWPSADLLRSELVRVQQILDDKQQREQCAAPTISVAS